MKSVFFLGMVRSGTSFLGRTLTVNSEDVYITHESDIVWILYNLYKLKNAPHEIKAYKWDDFSGTGHTLSECAAILQNYKNLSPTELFEQVQNELMTKGTVWQKINRDKTIYAGDKKPMQQSDLRIFEWCEKNIIEPKYIHLVRHPRDFLGSTKAFGKTRTLWGDNDADILKVWTKVQRAVMKIKKQIPDRVITIKYEDVCENTIQELNKIYTFLGVPERVYYNGEKIHQPTVYSDDLLDLEWPYGFKKLIKEFGYE